jgi:hypothetical protein
VSCHVDAMLGACLRRSWLSKKSSKAQRGNRLRVFHRRWMVLTDKCLAYYTQPTSKRPSGVIVFDNCLHVEYGFEVRTWTAWQAHTHTHTYTHSYSLCIRTGTHSPLPLTPSHADDADCERGYCGVRVTCSTRTGRATSLCALRREGCSCERRPPPYVSAMRCCLVVLTWFVAMPVVLCCVVVHAACCCSSAAPDVVARRSHVCHMPRDVV